MTRARIVDTIARALHALETSAMFRAALRFDPQDALAKIGIEVDLEVEELSLPTYGLTVYHDELTLFGSYAGPKVETAPLAARLVELGAKPMALLHGPEESLAPLVSWSEDHGLSAIFSPHEFDADLDGSKGGYSNLARSPRPTRPGSSGQKALLVAKREDSAIAGYLALLFSWDEALGRLLGYPNCCARAFAARWSEAVRSHRGDLVPMILAESDSSKRFDWRANVLARYFGTELVQHFPCRFDCEATIALGARHEEALAASDPARLAQLRSAMAAPFLFSESSGVAALVGARRDGDHVFYDPDRLRFTGRWTQETNALLRNRVLSILGPGRVEIGGEQYPAYVADFSVS